MANSFLAVPLALLLTAVSVAAEPVLPCRWVYVSRNLRTDNDVAEVGEIVRTAAAHGLTGMVLSAGLDHLDLKPPEFFTRLEAVKAACRERGVEIIPIIFSAGYGGSVLAHDENLAAGLPVEDALFVVQGRQARLAADPPVGLVNGGFEQHEGHRVAGYRFHDKPGEISFVDTEVRRAGQVSLRFQGFTKDQYRHGRLMQEVAVRPHRCYRVTCWVKTDGLEPEGHFLVQVLAKGRYIAPSRPRIASTADWHRVTTGFNSLEYDQVAVYVGTWGAERGRFWVDDLAVEEVGLVNVLRRPGTPVTVRGEASGTVYEEGRDYAPIADPRLNFRYDHDGPAIAILEGGRIADGERLRVGYYHGVAVNDGQVSVCMSEPKVYDIWRDQVRLIHRHLAPARYLLSMDEIRAGGSCQACKSRQMTMGEILGDCITRQVGLIRQVNPKAEVWCWSDMLDPHHNAHGDYYMVEGDFAGSWQHVPKDLGIVCWYFDKREPSLKHFSSLGFRTLAGAYYDGDDLENPMGWLSAVRQAPGACGIMYTTWRHKYALLAPFGDLVSKP